MTAHRANVAIALVAVGALVATTVLLAATRGGGRGPAPRVVTVSEAGATGAADVATGFAVAPMRIVTVAHVLDPGRALLVRTAGGPSRRGRVLRLDRAADLALIYVPGLAAPRWRAAAAAPGSVRLLLRRGGRVVAVAAAVRRRIRATVHQPGSPPYVRPGLELQARVRQGDSGAPVLDRRGAVAGVVFAQASDRPATAYAVDAAAVSALLE
jgi:S1-C subfamily serine protease